MNPRATYNLLLGWCPGVRAAAKFIPDKEVSNRRIAFSLAIVVTASILTYTGSNMILAQLNIPEPQTIQRSFNNPLLASRGGRLFMSWGQETHSSASSYTGPGYLSLGFYFGELQENGTITNHSTIANISRGASVSQSLLLSDDSWMIAYSNYTMYDILDSRYSPLYIIESTDGATWSKPAIVYDEPMRNQPTLLELPDGSLFLLFRTNYTWMYTIRDGDAWSEPAPAPYRVEAKTLGEFTYESAFIDSAGLVNVVWDEGSAYGNDLGLRYSTLLGGGWSEPQPITSNGVSLYGQDPRVFYSSVRGGYYLCVTSLQQTGSSEWRPITTLYFSRDWANWDELSYFDSWSYTLTELDDGSLARLVGDRGSHSLYYTGSGDGKSWSADTLVEMVADVDLLPMETAYFRSNFSFVASLITGLVALLLMTKIAVVK